METPQVDPRLRSILFPTVYASSKSLPVEETHVFAKHAACVASSIGAAGFLAVKLVNPSGFGQSKISGTLLSIGLGALIQSAIQFGLPRRLAEREMSVLADYTTPVFLSYSQVYLNIPSPNAVADNLILMPLTALAGACLTAFVYAYVTRKYAQAADETPINEGRRWTPSEPLKMSILSSKTHRIVWGVFGLLVCATATTLGAVFDESGFTRDFGIIYGSHSGAQLISELAYQKMKKNPQKRYVTFCKTVLPLAHGLPGMLMVGGAALSKIGQTPWGYPLYILAGSLAGFKRHLSRTRYTELPFEKLDEIDMSRKLPTKWERRCSYFNWGYATVVVGGFLVLGMLGLNASTGKFQPVQAFDTLALLSFGAGLYGSYSVAKLAKKWFDREIPGHKSPLTNFLYFYTNYSPGVPLLSMYITEKLSIGDGALGKDGVLTGLLSCLSWGLMGSYVGNEAYVRSNFAHPRVFSALAAALLGKFIIAEFAGDF